MRHHGDDFISFVIAISISSQQKARCELYALNTKDDADIAAQYPMAVTSALPLTLVPINDAAGDVVSFLTSQQQGRSRCEGVTLKRSCRNSY